MYKIEFDGTREEFCERLSQYREAKDAFKNTVNVPSPSEIFPILKIVEDNIPDEGFKLHLPGEEGGGD
tara:strand:- start:7399 stop:7602 length:204 start_codon:yes stop_codon:yes gene_type:complete